MTITRRGVVSSLLLGLILLLGWFAYAPALSGALLLDDVSNLEGLAHIHDLRSALVFIFSGNAGPLGRPIALASFALQADAWDAARPFLLINILIHLLNAGLLSWVCYRLAIAVGVPKEQRSFVAVSSAAIWLLMPLLASSSLMIVQRMTTLSGTFVLLALGGYLHAREELGQSAIRPYVLISACIVLGTLLAVFTKESGALLPVYVLILEATVLPRPASAGRMWRAWQLVFLILPGAAILVYLVSCVPYSEALVLKRDFTGLERLLTETQILWEYLFHAFIPQPGAFGPFHDGYPVARNAFDPVTVAAAASWIGMLAAALRWRRRYPLFALSILWFLGGHVLESTVVSLEIYFEHRNYLPIVGPVFAACAFLTKVPLEQRKLAYAGMSAYIMVNALVLFSNASLWGRPAEAAAYWETRFPASVRAATHVAQSRLVAGDVKAALQTLYRLADRQASAGYVLIPALNLSCMIAPETDHREEVSRIGALLGQVDFSYTAITMLSQLLTTASRTECEGLTPAAVEQLARALSHNPRYAVNTAYQSLHHQLLARIARDDGRFEDTIRELERAKGYATSADLNMMIVTTYADSGNFSAAHRYIDTARVNAPLNPFRKYEWLSGLDELEIYVDKLEEASASGTDAASGKT